MGHVHRQQQLQLLRVPVAAASALGCTCSMLIQQQPSRSAISAQITLRRTAGRAAWSEAAESLEPNRTSFYKHELHAVQVGSSVLAWCVLMEGGQAAVHRILWALWTTCIAVEAGCPADTVSFAMPSQPCAMILFCMPLWRVGLRLCPSCVVQLHNDADHGCLWFFGAPCTLACTTVCYVRSRVGGWRARVVLHAARGALPHSECCYLFWTEVCSALCTINMRALGACTCHAVESAYGYSLRASNLALFGRPGRA